MGLIYEPTREPPDHSSQILFAAVVVSITGNPVPKNGCIRYSDFKTQFTFQGIEEQEPQELQGFVDEHGPVATPEVIEVYGIQREDAVQRLEDLDSVSSFKDSGENFWY